MQKTQDDGDSREEPLPGQLGWQPAIKVDGLRRVVHIDMLRFALEMRIGFTQMPFIGFQT
jgi:hypothetical protein